MSSGPLAILREIPSLLKVQCHGECSAMELGVQSLPVMPSTAGIQAFLPDSRETQ